MGLSGWVSRAKAGSFFNPVRFEEGGAMDAALEVFDHPDVAGGGPF